MIGGGLNEPHTDSVTVCDVIYMIHPLPVRRRSYTIYRAHSKTFHAIQAAYHIVTFACSTAQVWDLH